ncbi:A/G-specific adenine glycosylase [Daejeonella lutea]|uniref:Adenine DNA glycosylase n=1 Tax=Daejeonella lutea TaxID=572036 RepID=A0A1T5DH82_9SPHI|nr:A/G-specific adenine glycosylase [Daejeonella lutea]SKB71085.1 A/G-specific DNA-adenine glycosylase [Daejeonella lutea]
MDFAGVIINWYQRHKRDLPWRHTTDPYIIWLSEIIMQQTRVEQGTPYFNRFAARYPTVSDFASASEDEILKLWQGLGYYSRGRNMHHTAQMVMESHGGYFPSNYNSLLKLKGIGEYTAAAISSFSSNEARAVVDGNVFRLLSRYFGLDIPINSGQGKKVFTELANNLIDKNQAGTYNQAVMEFGSLVCRPKNPDCPECPLQSGCEAYRTNRIKELPVKIKSQKIRERYFNYIIAIKGDSVLMNKRGPNDIWENLYELPLIETDVPTDPGELMLNEAFIKAFGNSVIIKSVSGPVKHILSHQKLYATFIQIENYSEQFANNNGWMYVKLQDLEGIAQPKLIFHFFKNFFKLKD